MNALGGSNSCMRTPRVTRSLHPAGPPTLLTPRSRQQRLPPARALPKPSGKLKVAIPTADKFTGARSFFQIALEQTTDSVSDIFRHLGRSQKKPIEDRTAADRVLLDSNKRKLRLKKEKPVLLVLGSGWAAHSLVKVIDTDIFDVIVISPRNHFIFTPMLPSSAVGTVEFRSLVEPIRSSNEFISYFEAECDSIDRKNKIATCTAACEYEDGFRPTFEVPYDLLVVSVGETTATFGTPGVAEHCFFMKEISDTLGLRKKIGECFELAALPGTTEMDRFRSLHFVVVGGGPTGVEFAGTLSDFLRTDLKKKYPELMRYVKVTLLQRGTQILTQFDAELGKRAMENLTDSGVTVRTSAGVTGVSAKQVLLQGGEVIDYGLCLWSCGNATRPLVQQLVEDIPGQLEAQFSANAGQRKLVVDPFLRVIGAEDLLAVGDCSRLVTGPLPPTAQVAGQQGAYVAHVSNGGYIWGMGGMEGVPVPCRVELTALPNTANKGFFKDASGPSSMYISGYNLSMMSMQGSIDGAQLAEAKRIYCSRPFHFLSLGMLAYIGNDKALTQIEAGLPQGGLKLYGNFAFILWRSVYITKQVSFRNRVLILFDWLKTRVFGRDTSIF